MHVNALRDLIEKDLTVVFCGINPGWRAAAAGHHFVGRGNRFWRVIHAAGFTPELIRPENDRDILACGCGLTTAVERPTVRADELAKHEFKAAAAGLERKIEQYAPRCIAFLGKAAYSEITRHRVVQWGRQSLPFGQAMAWVLPNPSGLNRSFSLDELVEAYRELRVAMEEAA
jgi:TDG/mug DNA glycosylase family protein